MKKDSSRERGLFSGVANIVRFNPYYFVVSGLILLAAIIFLTVFADTIPLALRHSLVAGVALSSWWFIASLVVSWWVYDLSSLYRWTWLPLKLTQAAEVVVAAHAGFDEVSAPLSVLFHDRELLIVDFHDPEYMTEKSIQRARRICPPAVGTIQVGRKTWGLPVRADLILFILSAHEWRGHRERVEILEGAGAELAEGGAVILVEHLRNPANFLAFGPGFLHFHSANTWERAWSEAGFSRAEEFGITPFVKCFILKILEPNE